VAFSWVWLVSDCRVTVAVPVLYPLLVPAVAWLEPRNAPLAGRRRPPPTTTTTPATSQPQGRAGPGQGLPGWRDRCSGLGPFLSR
jgi:hypothetical protein